jgi:hypothetical protein
LQFLSGGIFCSFFDSLQHPPIHREANRLDESRSELQLAEDVIGVGATEPANQSAALGAQGLHEK